MLNAHTYLEVVSSRGQRDLELERVHHNLRNKDLFLTAYSNLYSNKGALTAGVDPSDSIDGMSTERIDKLIDTLKDGTFRWKPTKRVYIPKKNGKLRPLGMPSWNDKLVQEAIRLILNAYYEPQFSKHSHGFRPKRSCHTALKEIVKEWRGITWFIEGDIKGCFDNIDHELLLQILGRKIKDEKFLKLMREMLKVGYLEDWKYHQVLSGTPQGGVISPLLSNIFLNELDKFMEEVLLPKYNIAERYKGRRINPEYNRLRYLRDRASKAGHKEEAESWDKLMKQQRYWSDTGEYRRLRYIRYADDFLLGFTGPKQEAEAIKQEIKTFLATLKLEMSDEKTLITHASTESARFLGYEVSIALENSRRKSKRRTINGSTMLRIPEDVKKKWEAKYQAKGKVVHLTERIDDTDFDIISQYQSELQGLVNYYRMAVNAAGLWKIKWIMETSLTKTLARKHKTSVTWIYQHYKGKNENGLKTVEVKVQREEKPPLVAQFGGIHIRYERTGHIEDAPEKPMVLMARTQLVDRLLAEKCELCGSGENVEVHHIKSIKSLIQKYRKRGTEMPIWTQRMAEIHRNTLVVCKSCHTKIHNGTYDGIRLKLT